MIFDRVVCINLDRRPDRWDEFSARIPDDWPFGPIDRFTAVDGDRVPFAPWWTAGRGAWGCYQSHLTILQQALNDGLTSVLILEDDALFCDDFVLAASEYFAALPDNWGLAYLGGQHLHIDENPPQRVNAHVFRPFNVNRTHAFAIRGKSTMSAIYKHLLDYERWNTADAHHVDHHLGQLIESQKIPVYCPNQWLMFQAQSHSNIRGEVVPQREWNAWAVTDDTVPMVAVMGPFRGGTSCTAGVLHTLGVSMGTHFAKPMPSNPKGFFEAVQLAKICRRSYKEPRMREMNKPDDRVIALRRWATNRRSLLEIGQLAGGKHPTMCMLGPELLEAWGNVRWVSVERPVEDVITSLLSRGWGWPPPVARSTLPMLIRRRDTFLATVDAATVLRLEYYDLIAEPMREIDRLIQFLEISPTAEQYRAALDFVDPVLMTVSA